MPDAPLNLDRTRAALAAYDAGWEARERLFADAQNNADMVRWQAQEGAARMAVLRAFFEDTAGFNSLANCLLADLAWLRRLCDAENT